MHLSEIHEDFTRDLEFRILNLRNLLQEGDLVIAVLFLLGPDIVPNNLHLNLPVDFDELVTFVLLNHLFLLVEFEVEADVRNGIPVFKHDSGFVSLPNHGFYELLLDGMASGSEVSQFDYQTLCGYLIPEEI